RAPARRRAARRARGSQWSPQPGAAPGRPHSRPETQAAGDPPPRPGTPAPGPRAGPGRARAARPRTATGRPARALADDAPPRRSPPGAALPVPSGLLDVDQERLVLGRPRVGVAHERRQGVGQPVRPLRRVAVRRDADEPPVDRDADLVDLLAPHLDRAEPLGDDGRNLELAPLRAHPDAIAVLDPLLARQLLGNLDERLGL